jgi:hypothetical protein
MSTASPVAADAGTGWALPALLDASFFLRACALQALGEAALALDEHALPPVSGAAMAAALASQLPEPRPSAAELLEAGAALQAVMQQQPLPVCDPRQVFGSAAYAPPFDALPLHALLALVEACDLACLPEKVRDVTTACLAQRSARQRRGALQSQVATSSPRCASLLQQWWRDTYRGADFGPVIRGDLAAWRAAHPTALVANLHGRQDLTDKDFAALHGVQALSLFDCKSITDAAFVHLTGVHTLSIGQNGDGYSFTDAAFAHLRGIHSLNMYACRSITDKAFVHLAGIHTLNMGSCSQRTITDAAFSHLTGIRELRMDMCSEHAINAARARGLPVKTHW